MTNQQPPAADVEAVWCPACQRLAGYLHPSATAYGSPIWDAYSPAGAWLTASAADRHAAERLTIVTHQIARKCDRKDVPRGTTT